jgi:hypothetical protein
MDYDKLASSLGGSLQDNDFDKLASQFGGQLAPPTPEPTLSPEEQMMSSVGEGSGTEFKDIGKLAAASAVKSVLGSPEAIQAAGSGIARDTLFKPTEALNFLADPRKLTGMLTDIPGQINEKLSGAFGPKAEYQGEKLTVVPEKLVNKQRIALDEVLTKGKVDALKDITKYGNEISKQIEDTVSPEMKEALANSEPTGNILEALDKGDFSKVSFGKAPTAQGLFGQAARVFGSAAPGVLTSFVTRSATPGAVFGLGQAAGEGVDTAREYISKMSDTELAKNSEYYRNLLVLGYPPKEARAMTEDKAGDTAAYYQGTVGALGGAFTGNLVAGKLDATKLLNAKNVLTRIVKGATVGTTEEGAQELAEGIATDLGIDRTVVREIGVDSFANAVLGAIGGGGPGAVSGAMAKTETPPPPPGAAPAAGADTTQVTPPAVPPVAPMPVKMAEIKPEELEEAEPITTPVTAVTPPAEEVKPKKTTFEKKPNDPAIEAEAIQIADEIERLGNPAFAAGFRGTIEKTGGLTKPEDLAFAKKVLLETQQKAGSANVMPQETFNIENYLPSSNKSEVKRFKEFLPNAPEEVKAITDKSNQYLQQLTDKLNSLGYKVLEVDGRAPLEVRDLKAKISGIAGSTFSYVKNAEHIARENRFANPDKLAKIAQTLEQDFAEADQLLGAEDAKPKAAEVVQKPVKVERELPKRSSAKDIPVLTKDEVLDSTDPENIKKVNEILKDYEVESGQSIEGNFLDAIDRNIKSKEEEIKAPPISKSSVIPTAEIRVAPYNGGFLASSSYTGKGNGYSSPISVFGKTYPTRQEAIDAEANRIRKYAQEDKNTVALKWLDSVSKPTKKGQVEINKARQAEKKAKVEKPVEVVKPKTEEIVSPEVAASMKDIEFQNRLIKANNDKTITKIQFSRLFKLYQDGKTPQANEQLTKMLAKNEKKAKKEEPEEEHIEGNKTEPVTSKTIEDAIDKAESKVDYNKIKTAVKNQFDQAIKRAKIQTEKEWTAATVDENSYVTIDIPGDGKFKVKNNVERLKELQTKITNAVTPKAPKLPTGPSSGSLEAFKGMVDDKDMENAIEYAKLKGLDPKTVKLSPAQRTTVDKYLKNPAEFDRQKEESEQMREARQTALRADQEKRIAERLEADQEREEDARFKAVLDTTIASTEAQLKRDIAAKKISTKDARRMVEVFPNYPEGTLKPYTIRLIEKRAGAEPSFKQLRKNVTEDGQLLNHPMIDELVNTDKYEMLDLRNPRTYVDKGGVPHRTFERNGVRIALTIGEKLFQTKGKENQPVQTGIGTDKDVHFNALLVDPQDRRQGKATRALNTIRHVADRHMLNVYLEPAELEKNGITKTQLSEMYSKFQFKPTNEVGKVMLREPESYSVMMDRINAEMKAEGKESSYAVQVRQLAELKKQVAEMEAKKAAVSPDEARTIDVQATVITPSQMKLLTNQVGKLSDADIATLEEHYGIPNYSDTFMKRIREDIITYTNKGAEAIDKAIRDIIAKLQAGVLAVAMVFNPAYMSQQSAVLYPTKTVTQEVKATVPESASEMSASGKKAYATLYPALQPGLQAEDKLFTIVDKPTSKVYVFNPDGSLLAKDNVVLGMALGDVYVGKTDYKANRITPAGLMKVKAETGGATYDGKTIYTVGNVAEGWNTAFIHTVYLKESDAEARKKALETGKESRLSHGCVNAKPELMEKIAENNRMDGSHVFVVPDNQAMTDAYISNNVSNQDLTRETVKPVTVTTKAPEKGARAIGSIDIVGREEEAIIPKTQAQINQERREAKLAAQRVVDEGPFFNNFDAEFNKGDYEEGLLGVRDEQIKWQSYLSRQISKTTKEIADYGSDLNIQSKLNYLLDTKKEVKAFLNSTKQERRGIDWFKARAAEAKAEKQLSPEAMAVVDTLVARYPGIFAGLKLSVKQSKQAGVAGNFSPIQRLVTIYHSALSPIFDSKSGEKQAVTMRHEIAHSLEQMMTPEQQSALVEAWADGLAKAIKANPGPAEQDFFKAAINFSKYPTKENFDKATNLIPPGRIELYQYMNPSEFWAVNAEKLMKAQLGTPWARFVKAVKKIWEVIKSVFGFDNRYAIHREFDRIMSGDKELMTTTMLASYVKQMTDEIDFLRNYEDIAEENESVPEVPDTDPKSFKEMMIGSYNRVVENAKDIVKNPKNNTMKGLENASEGVLYTRIKNVWFAAGLEARDFAKYVGQIRTSEGLAIASLAVKNAIHAGSISTQVLIQGGLEYSEDFLQFVAVKRDHSMKNVAALQYEIRKMLGRKEGDKTIQAYLVAKRSRSIYNTYLDAQANLETAVDDFNKAARGNDEDARTDAYNKMKAAEGALEQAIIAYQKIPTYLRQLDEDGETIYETVQDRDGQKYKLPVLNDEEIDKFINRENKIPQLAKIMENFTAVNHNMIDMMVKSSRISEQEGKRLKAIKDYVPWNRVMDESEELFDNRRIPSMPSNIKYFKKGETERDIGNIIDNMNHNITMMTRSAIRNYAQVRISQEYARRKDNGKLQVYPREGKFETGVRVPLFIAGKKYIVEIPDSMVAEAILGMIAPPYEIPMQKLFSAASQLVRRTVTFSAYFQMKQVFYDAPTAAWVSGVRNPLALWAGCFTGFVKAVNPLSNDPVVEILRSAGIGGFQSFHRTAKKEQDIELGLIRHSKFAFLLRSIDHIGDASDYSQRIATYNRVLKETGDKALAMMQAADVIDFQKHGNGRLAQALRVSVTFMQAYATQLDVLTQAMVGGNLKGQSRAEAAAKFHATGVAMASLMVLWAMMACGDDDYHELDDDTKARNLYLPYSKKIFGHHILIPLKSSAAMFYKVIPETLYYKISQEGTKNEMDKTRLWKAAGNAAVDMLLGPTPIPSAIKGGVEISLDRNFFTGGKITPSYLKNLEASRQFSASTSELGKLFSAATQIPFTGEKGKENKRVLNPLEADHLMRSLGGSVATTSMYFANMVFNSDRPSTQLKENPLLGGLIGADVPRRNENLFYDLKERADQTYATFQDIIKNDRKKGADYREANIKMIQAHGYTSGIEQNLNAINTQIRRLSRSEDLNVEEQKMTPEQKRNRINYFNQLKQDILKDVIERRKAAGL